jgi:hypothetical protein
VDDRVERLARGGQRICATLQEHVSGHWTISSKVCEGLTAASQQTLYI